MKSCAQILPALALAVVTLSIGWSAEPVPPAAKPPPAMAAATLTEAHRQAEILHRAMHSTLQIVHHGYYREDEGLPIPAAVLKDVFAELEEEQHVKLRWLAVEGKAMNADHKPRDPFEEAAAKALAAGKPEYVQAANGIYRRAGPITLTNHCLKCHVPDRKSTEDRTAGLIISIPIREN